MSLHFLTCSMLEEKKPMGDTDDSFQIAVDEDICGDILLFIQSQVFVFSVKTK